MSEIPLNKSEAASKEQKLKKRLRFQIISLILLSIVSVVYNLGVFKSNEVANPEISKQIEEFRRLEEEYKGREEELFAKIEKGEISLPGTTLDPNASLVNNVQETPKPESEKVEAVVENENRVDESLKENLHFELSRDFGNSVSASYKLEKDSLNSLTLKVDLEVISSVSTETTVEELLSKKVDSKFVKFAYKGTMILEKNEESGFYVSNYTGPAFSYFYFDGENKREVLSVSIDLVFDPSQRKVILNYIAFNPEKVGSDTSSISNGLTIKEGEGDDKSSFIIKDSFEVLASSNEDETKPAEQAISEEESVKSESDQLN